MVLFVAASLAQPPDTSTAGSTVDGRRGATIGEGLAVQGEEVRDADQAVPTWLRRNRLHT
jgi:hypothetical protein